MKLLLYGTTAMLADYCSACDAESLVSDGVLACCGLRVKQSAPTEWKRMSPVPGGRKWIPKALQSRLIADQNEECYWCKVNFKKEVFRHGLLVKRKIAFDHWIPVSFVGDIHECNLVASCSICNGIKTNFLFPTEDDCRKYIMLQWRNKKLTTETPFIEIRPVFEATG